MKEYNKIQIQQLGDLDQVVNRLELLDNIITFLFKEIEVTVDGEKVWRKRDIITDGEKICVNQERACLRDYRDFLLGYRSEEDVRFYKVSDIVEKKLQKCISTMKDLKWYRRIEDIEVNDSNTL